MSFFAETSELSTKILNALSLILSQLGMDDVDELLNLALDELLCKQLWKLAVWLSFGQLGYQILVAKCQNCIFSIEPLSSDFFYLL